MKPLFLLLLSGLLGATAPAEDIKIYVFGAVDRPGSYMVERNMSLQAFLLEAEERLNSTGPVAAEADEKPLVLRDPEVLIRLERKAPKKVTLIDDVPLAEVIGSESVLELQENDFIVVLNPKSPGSGALPPRFRVIIDEDGQRIHIRPRIDQKTPWSRPQPGLAPGAPDLYFTPEPPTKKKS